MVCPVNIRGCCSLLSEVHYALILDGKKGVEKMPDTDAYYY